VDTVEVDNTLETWVDRFHLCGVEVEKVFLEVKEFAFEQFAHLDADQDGFISEPELKEALNYPDFSIKQKAFVTFLLRRSEMVSKSYKEEWADGRKGISLVDIQEYFAAHHRW
jgi:hypothetical protein